MDGAKTMIYAILKAVYATLGAPHPIASLVAVSLFGALLGAIIVGGGWFMLGQQYQKDQRGIVEKNKAESIIAKNSTVVVGKNNATAIRGSTVINGNGNNNNGSGSNYATATNGGVAVAGNKNTVTINEVPAPSIGQVDYFPSEPREYGYQTRILISVKNPLQGGTVIGFFRTDMIRAVESVRIKGGSIVTSSGSFPFALFQLTLYTKNPIEKDSLTFSVSPQAHPIIP